MHLQLFLRDVILSKSSQPTVRARVQLLAEEDFRFELQVSPSDDLLNANNGVIVGVTYSGTQLPAFDAAYQKEGGGRPDALVADVANDLNVLFEVKLGDSLYNEQIERHFRSFFDQSSTTRNQVFIEITWNEIAEFLQRVVRQSVNGIERYVASEFVRYLDWLMLVSFLGFQTSDFVAQNDKDFNQGKLNNFLLLMTRSLGPKLGLNEYQNNRMLFFHDVPHENVWVEMTEGGVYCGIVCGSGKKWATPP